MDSLLYFYESKDAGLKIIVQVKGGAAKRGDVAIPALTGLGDVNSEKAAGGVLLTFEKPIRCA